MAADLSKLLGKEVSFNYADGNLRIVRVEKVGHNYICGERTKDGKTEKRSYNLNKMTNLVLTVVDPFFAPQFNNANAGRMG